MKNSFAELNKIVEDLVFAVSQIHELPLIEKDLLMEQFRRVYAHIALCEEVKYEDDTEIDSLKKEIQPNTEEKKPEAIEKEPVQEPVEDRKPEIANTTPVVIPAAKPIEEPVVKPIERPVEEHVEKPVVEPITKPIETVETVEKIEEVDEEKPIEEEIIVEKPAAPMSAQEKADNYNEFVQAFKEADSVKKDETQKPAVQEVKKETAPISSNLYNQQLKETLLETETTNKTADYISHQFVEEKKEPVAPKEPIAEPVKPEPIPEPVVAQPINHTENVVPKHEPVIQENDLFSEPIKQVEQTPALKMKAQPHNEAPVQQEVIRHEAPKAPEKQPEPFVEDDLLEFISPNKPESQPQPKPAAPVQKPSISGQPVHSTYQPIGNKRSLNDLIHEQHREDHSLSNQYQHAKVVDLTKAISINDKFTYIRELFKNRGEEFSAAIQKLNHCDNLEQAFDELENLKKHYYWDSTSNAYLSLCDLIRRKFA